MVIASFFYGWEKLTHFHQPTECPPLLVSVIVPMRDEENNITHLLYDLVHQSYPSENIEIIVVDDHSSDRSVEVAKSYSSNNIKVISLPEDYTGKKAALNFGMKNSKGELIITTDADCTLGNNWLRSIVSYYLQENPVMILAPVIPLCNSGSIWEKGWKEMRSLELFSLSGSTAGSAGIGHPVMCNGANLAFSKAVYQDVEHIYANTKIASGDDIFTMLELKKKYPGRIHFLKSADASVHTSVSGNLKSFFKQRGRWAAKSRFYKDPAIIFTALIVFGTNLLMLITFIRGFMFYNFLPFFTLLTIKSLIDFLFLFRVTSFFGEKKLMTWFPIAQGVYFFYVCITILFAMIIPNHWKGRSI